MDFIVARRTPFVSAFSSFRNIRFFPGWEENAPRVRTRQDLLSWLRALKMFTQLRVGFFVSLAGGIPDVQYRFDDGVERGQ
jgi:hypothetical protein